MRRAVRLLAMVILVDMTLTTSSQAAQLYISPTGSDSHPCTQSLPCLTLQHAVNVASSGDTINLATGTYSKNFTSIESKNLSILGAGASDTILLGLGQSNSLPVIDIVGNSVVTISSITITEGGAGAIVLEGETLTLENCVVSNSSGFSVNAGGGITNFGTLTLRETTVTNNQSPDAGGGGIENFGGITTIIRSTISGNSSPRLGGGGIHVLQGLVTLSQSTISGNSGLNGGGILSNASTVQVLNSTISGNTASNSGGGIEADNNSIVELNNATIANNRADAGFSGGTGGGLNMSLTVANTPSSTVTLNNTILAFNVRDFSGFPFVAPNDCGIARLDSGGYNLLGFIGRCSLFSPGTDRTKLNPDLGPLQNNGGPTETMLPLTGSPVIDAGNPAGCTDPFGNKLTADQRGLPRPDADDTRCDIGAVEVQQ